MKRCFTVLILAAALALAAGVAEAADPTTGDCLAASEASLKLGNLHKVRAERGQLLVCASTNCPADIRKECTRRVELVNAQIPTIIFEATDAAGNDLSAVKVSMDGELLAERLEGTSLSIDPGEHTFTFETLGLPTAQKTLQIRQSEKDRRQRVSFGAATASNSSAGAAASSYTSASSTDAAPASRASGLGTQKVAAIAAGSMGVVGLALGTVFGLQASSKRSDARDICPNECADQRGVDAWSSAKSAGNVATVFFVVGAVGLAGGAVLWLTAKPSSQEALTAQMSAGLGTIEIRGQW